MTSVNNRFVIQVTTEVVNFIVIRYIMLYGTYLCVPIIYTKSYHNTIIYKMTKLLIDLSKNKILSGKIKTNLNIELFFF